MNKIPALFLAFTAVLAMGIPAQAQAQHTHIRYFDENGDPVEEHGHGEHDGHGRGDEGRTFLYAFTGIAPRFGLALQKSLFAEVGISLDRYHISYAAASEYVSFAYSNLRPYLSGEIMAGRKLLGGGKAGLEYIMSTPVFGMAAGADVSYHTDGKGDAVLFTPRLMLSFVQVEVFYGYNFFIHNELTRHIGRHRFGVSMTLSSRFWKRKREFYNDYYNSYGAADQAAGSGNPR